MQNFIDYDLQEITNKIKIFAIEIGFSQVGISDLNLADDFYLLGKWLDENNHGTMDYLAKNIDLRKDITKLHPNTLRVISVRLNYFPNNYDVLNLSNNNKAYISSYAGGRDYHKLMRKKLKNLGEKIKELCNSLDYRPFVDSAPILERPLAIKAGLGWRGKHGLIINKNDGSFFFLGELLVNIPLKIDTPVIEQCGKCISCLKICPTGAITKPYWLNANLCISYLTIEYKGIIPLELRSKMSNKIYGCDDCQLICPWNKYAKITNEIDFNVRDKLKNKPLLELFAWNENEFLKFTEGSPIRRIGFEQWQRNIAVALGNADFNLEIIKSLKHRLTVSTELVKTHIKWAIEQQEIKKSGYKQENRKLKRLINVVEKHF